MKHVPMFQRIDYDLMTGCWNWTGWKDSHGYGMACHEGKQYLVHRLSAHIFLGFDLDSDLRVCHKCDNTSCINPKHLFIGTQRDNCRDMWEKRRYFNSKKTHCKRGHEFTPENTYRVITSKRNERHCKECERLRQRKVCQ